MVIEYNRITGDNSARGEVVKKYNARGTKQFEIIFFGGEVYIYKIQFFFSVQLAHEG